MAVDELVVSVVCWFTIEWTLRRTCVRLRIHNAISRRRRTTAALRTADHEALTQLMRPFLYFFRVLMVMLCIFIASDGTQKSSRLLRRLDLWRRRSDETFDFGSDFHADDLWNARCRRLAPTQSFRELITFHRHRACDIPAPEVADGWLDPCSVEERPFSLCSAAHQYSGCPDVQREFLRVALNSFSFSRDRAFEYVKEFVAKCSTLAALQGEWPYYNRNIANMSQQEEKDRARCDLLSWGILSFWIRGARNQVQNVRRERGVAAAALEVAVEVAKQFGSNEFSRDWAADVLRPMADELAGYRLLRGATNCDGQALVMAYIADGVLPGAHFATVRNHNHIFLAVPVGNKTLTRIDKEQRAKRSRDEMLRNRAANETEIALGIRPPPPEPFDVDEFIFLDPMSALCPFATDQKLADESRAAGGGVQYAWWMETNASATNDGRKVTAAPFPEAAGATLIQYLSSDHEIHDGTASRLNLVVDTNTRAARFEDRVCPINDIASQPGTHYNKRPRPFPPLGQRNFTAPSTVHLWKLFLQARGRHLIGFPSSAGQSYETVAGVACRESPSLEAAPAYDWLCRSTRYYLGVLSASSHNCT